MRTFLTMNYYNSIWYSRDLKAGQNSLMTILLKCWRKKLIYWFQSNNNWRKNIKNFDFDGFFRTSVQLIKYIICTYNMIPKSAKITKSKILIKAIKILDFFTETWGNINYISWKTELNYTTAWNNLQSCCLFHFTLKIIWLKLQKLEIFLPSPTLKPIKHRKKLERFFFKKSTIFGEENLGLFFWKNSPKSPNTSKIFWSLKIFTSYIKIY